MRDNNVGWRLAGSLTLRRQKEETQVLILGDSEKARPLPTTERCPAAVCLGPAAGPKECLLLKYNTAFITCHQTASNIRGRPKPKQNVWKHSIYLWDTIDARSERKTETVVSSQRLDQVLHPSLSDKAEEETERKKLEMKYTVVKMEVLMKGLDGKSGSLRKNGKTKRWPIGKST